MFLERIYDEDLAQASYLIGCQASGQAIVIDPRRDVEVYVSLAKKNGMSIVGVAETHIHADYLSGTREVAARTGATMYVSDEGAPDWRYGEAFDAATRVRDGHRIVLGNVVLEAVHTPGHTPEHLSYLVVDGATADAPGFLLSGDFVFVGDVGRPDLLDEAAGGVDTRYEAARTLYASLRDRFLTLPDYVQVLPGHGSGSACGRSLGAIAASTVGYERAFAWWAPYLESGDEDGFVAELLDGQPDAHAYFARMKVQNKQGPRLLDDVEGLREFSAGEVSDALAADTMIFVDTRSASAVHAGTVERSLAIPGTGKTASFGAWVYDPETEDRPLVVLAPSAQDAARVYDHLIRVGIDRVIGYVRSLDGLPLSRPEIVTAAELDHVEYDVLLDVRNWSEYDAGHLPGAVQLNAGRALWSAEDLPAEGRIITYCRSGARNLAISSALRRRGLNVTELQGSYLAWADHQQATNAN